jgi:hypothetical protein
MKRFRIVERNRPVVTLMDYTGTILDRPRWSGELYPTREILQQYGRSNNTMIQERLRIHALGHVATLPFWKDDMPVKEALMFFNKPEL